MVNCQFVLLSIFKNSLAKQFTIDHSLLYSIKGIEPLLSARKAGVLAVRRIEQIMSGKQDSNLRPPASKTGKQPPLSFQFFRFSFQFLFREAPELKYSLNLAVYAGIEPAVPKRQSGRLAFTSIDLFCNSERDRTSNLRFRKPTLYPIELQNYFVIPEGIEPSTPGLKDRCSDQLSYEIVFNFVNGQLSIVNLKLTSKAN